MRKPKSSGFSSADRNSRILLSAFSVTVMTGSVSVFVSDIATRLPGSLEYLSQAGEEPRVPERMECDGVGGDVARWCLGRHRPRRTVEARDDIGELVDRLEVLVQDLRPRKAARRVDQLRGGGNRVERHQHVSRMSGDPRAEGHRPELVRTDE